MTFQWLTQARKKTVCTADTPVSILRYHTLLMPGNFKELVGHHTCSHIETSTLAILQDQVHQVPETEAPAHAWKIDRIQHTLILLASLGSGVSTLHSVRSPVAGKHPLKKRLS